MLDHLRNRFAWPIVFLCIALLTGCKTTNLGGFTMPSAADKPVPAVILVGGMGASAGRYEFHGPALLEAGFAVYEADWWQKGGGYDVFQSMKFLFRTLLELQNNPAIDRNRIAVMGFSRGGGIALRAANIWWTNRYDVTIGFAAHVPFYPVCNRPKTRSALRTNATGAPILILAAEDDSNGDGETCPHFVDTINAVNPGLAELKLYPGVGHGFDADFGWHSAAALDSRRRAVAFLKSTFGKSPEDRQAHLFLSKRVIRRDIIGNTLKFRAPRNGRILFVYFAEDGTVEVKPQGVARTFRKSWSFNKSGWLCRTVGRNNRKLCQKITKVGPSEVELSRPVLGLRFRANILAGRQLSD